MTDNRNTILAVILSGLVLIGWQYFFNVPQMEKQRAASRPRASWPSPRRRPAPPAAPRPPRRPARHPRRTRPRPISPPPAPPVVSRDAAIAAAPRIKIDTPRAQRQHLAEGRAHRRSVAGAIPRHRRSATRPRSCCSRRRARASPYYAEFGWVPATGSTVRLPDQNTMWQQEGSGSLDAEQPGDAEI